MRGATTGLCSKITACASLAFVLSVVCFAQAPVGEGLQDSTLRDKFERIDLHTDGALRRWFELPNEKQKMRELVQEKIRRDPETRSLYLDLLVHALNESANPDDWSLGFIFAIAPDGIGFLSLVLPEMRSGGRLENVLIGEKAKFFTKKIEGDQYRLVPDFSAYLHIIQSHSPEAYRPVLAYMVTSSPEHGFEEVLSHFVREIDEYPDVYTSFRKIEDWRWLADMELGERIGWRDDAPLEALDLLSKRTEWWVRLYVAQRCSEYFELRDARIVDLLAADPDLLVRMTVATFTPGMGD